MERERMIEETKKKFKEMCFNVYADGVSIGIFGFEVYVDFDHCEYCDYGNVMKYVAEKAFNIGCDITKEELKQKAKHFFD